VYRRAKVRAVTLRELGELFGSMVSDICPLIVRDCSFERVNETQTEPLHASPPGGTRASSGEAGEIGSGEQVKVAALTWQPRDQLRRTGLDMHDRGRRGPPRG
jgi:predicted carbohydrate-binding protein with CBM5 and CBM33 domain